MSQNIKINCYDTFRCIADQCPFHCCQEWRIGVDEKTLHKWEGLKLNRIESDEESKPEISLCSCVKKEEAGGCIILDQDKQCQFLNKKKLCRVVLELGEDFLSETCTVFPRQINKFEDRVEYALDAGCPAVIDLLNQNLESVHLSTEGEYTKSELYLIRELILTMIQDEDYTLSERMLMIFYILLDFLEETSLTEEKINSYKSKKSLTSLVKAIRKMNFNKVDSFLEKNELFLDVVENYRKQKLYVNYIEGIATLAEQIEEDYDNPTILTQLKQFEKEFDAYEKLVKNYLVVEIFGSGLSKEMDLEDMVVAFQWVVLQYAVLKQAIFLKWQEQDKGAIEYSMVRDYITIISRVTGYGQGDIREYMENSFEDVIWEWGYLALILGNDKV